MHLFIGFEPFMLAAKILGRSYFIGQRTIEIEDLRTSIMLAFSDGVLYVTVFSHHFNSQAALYGKETYVETADPPETRVTRLVVDRYGDQWEITCGVRTTVRQRFTRPKHLNIWIARSITYPDTKSFGFNLSSSPENLLSTVSSIRHDLLP